ncbi:hypothetical protein MKX01_041466, partial [Papaver californicum]
GIVEAIKEGQGYSKKVENIAQDLFVEIAHREDTEKEARLAIEKLHASLTGELEKAQEDLSNANQRIESLIAMYRKSQEYNSRLQVDCETFKANLAHAEQERASVTVERLSTFRVFEGH